MMPEASSMKWPKSMLLETKCSILKELSEVFQSERTVADFAELPPQAANFLK
jgi:hypothetical protein